MEYTGNVVTEYKRGNRKGAYAHSPARAFPFHRCNFLLLPYSVRLLPPFSCYNFLGGALSLAVLFLLLQYDSSHNRCPLLGQTRFVAGESSPIEASFREREGTRLDRCSDLLVSSTGMTTTPSFSLDLFAIAHAYFSLSKSTTESVLCSPTGHPPLFCSMRPATTTALFPHHLRQHTCLHLLDESHCYVLPSHEAHQPLAIIVASSAAIASSAGR